MGIQKQCYIGGYIHIPPVTTNITVKVKYCPNNHSKQKENFCSVCGTKLVTVSQTEQKLINANSVLRSYMDARPETECQWIVNGELICFESRQLIDSHVDLHENYGMLRLNFLRSFNLELIIGHIRTNFKDLEYSVGFGPYVIWN